MGRLFWKIFTWFWVAIVLIALGAGISVRFYLEYSHFEIRQQLPKAKIAAATLAIERANIERVKELLKVLSESSQHPIYVLDQNRRELLGRTIPPELRPRGFHGPPPPGTIRRRLQSSDGQHYLLLAHAPRRHSDRSGHFWHFPYSSTIAILIALLISTLVCFWLARYLTNPMKVLSRASNQIAAGKLDTRVGNIGNRKDEIADLARDFDAMAERIQSLIDGHSQLMSDVSHELRSPLTRLQVAVALARHQANPDDLERINTIERDIQRLEELINQVLTLSRLENISNTREKISLDLSELVKTLVEDIQMEADQKNCRIVLNIENTIAISGDAELLRRAIENVIRNAVYYTDADSEVTVDYKVVGSHTCIDIGDNGPGVPESKLEDIFNPFFRTDRARERNSGGRGLGLAIARRAMQAHGGTITAKSKPGGGLIISLQIPS